MNDNEGSRFDCHRTDEDGQQRHGDHQQDGEGGAGIDVSAHQTHNET